MYRIRRGIAAGALFFLIGATVAVLLVPALVISRVKLEDVSQRLSNARKVSQARLNPETRKIVEDTAELLAILTMPAPPLFAHGGFAEIVLMEKPSGISIAGIFYDGPVADIENAFRYSLRGVATTREVLFSFVETLKTNKLFSAVDLPVSNFVKDSDIEFSVTLVMNMPRATVR